MNAVTHLEKVIVGEVSAVTHIEKVIAGETSAVTYTEKVITGEAPPITHLQKVIAGVESPVTHLEYIWAGGSPTPTEHEYTGAVPYTFRANGTPLLEWYIKGNTVQSATPIPQNPVMPEGCGDLETSGAKAGQYKIPISSASTTTPVYLGEVQTTRKIKKYVFTGQETFYASSQTSVFYTTAISNLCNKTVTYSTGCLCNAYKLRKQSTAANLQDGEYTTDTNGYVWFRNYDYSTLQDLKAYLQQQYSNGTPVTVWYVLATEETTVVNEPLMKIGEYADEVSNVATIPTNNGSTTIDVETAVKPSEVYIKYKGV